MTVTSSSEAGCREREGGQFDRDGGLTCCSRSSEPCSMRGALPPPRATARTGHRAVTSGDPGPNPDGPSGSSQSSERDDSGGHGHDPSGCRRQWAELLMTTSRVDGQALCAVVGRAWSKDGERGSVRVRDAPQLPLRTVRDGGVANWEGKRARCPDDSREYPAGRTPRVGGEYEFARKRPR